MRSPRRDHYLAPRAGTDSRAVVDAAVESLSAARDLHPQEAPSRLHVLASLAAELEARLRPAVADARQYGCSWAEVADLLGVTRASAWQRYGGEHAAEIGSEADGRRAAAAEEKEASP
jgi:uncharacterized NAD(P)/FAD-binding protein YdhS